MQLRCSSTFSIVEGVGHSSCGSKRAKDQLQRAIEEHLAGGGGDDASPAAAPASAAAAAPASVAPAAAPASAAPAAAPASAAEMDAARAARLRRFDGVGAAHAAPAAAATAPTAAPASATAAAPAAAPAPPPTAPPSIKEMKATIKRAGLPTADLVEKPQVEERYARAVARLAEVVDLT